MGFRSRRRLPFLDMSGQFCAPLAYVSPRNARAFAAPADTPQRFSPLRLTMTHQFVLETARRSAIATSITGLLLLASSAGAQQNRVVRVSLPDALQLAESRSEAV